MVKQRIAGIEVYRCLLMFGICWLHAMTQCGYKTHGHLDNILSTCVIGFVVISSWFGISFRLSKLVRFVVMVLSCICLRTILCLVIDDNFTFGSFISECSLRITKGWFTWGYVFLMLLSPLVDELAKRLKDVRSALSCIVPLFICIFVWGFGTNLPVIGGFLPKFHGSNSLSCVTLFGIYAVVRIARESLGFISLPKKQMMVSVFVLLPLVYWGVFQHNSPTGLAFAVFCFAIAKEVPCPSSVGNFARILAPSMYAVLIYHSGLFGYTEAIYGRIVSLHTMPLPVMHFLGGVAFFFLGLLCDFPRRIVVFCFKDNLTMVCMRMDEFYGNIIDKLVSQVERIK